MVYELYGLSDDEIKIVEGVWLKNVFLLAKIFENQKYMQDFCNGKLYMNSLAYFKDIEWNDPKTVDTNLFN